jgi:CRP-like cAMP-binding protein
MALSRFLELFLARRDALDDDERRALAMVPVRREAFDDGAVVIEGGRAPEESCLLIAGMAMRVHRIGAGERVVSALHVPGDFVDLHAFLLRHLDHDVVAAGPCRVEFVPVEALREITRTSPHLTRLLWLCTLIDAKIHRVWIATGAALLAPQRVGHLICELHARLGVVGLAEGDRFDMALDQRGLAEVLGYSVVHTNRAVQDLRGRGLLVWEGGTVALPDPGGLAAFSGFSADYLELSPTRR